MITEHGFRVLEVEASNEKFSFLFIPGGPGIGSKYLEPFCKKLHVPGAKYLIDFPKDGDNPEGDLSINNWKTGLLDLCKTFDNPILVTHSFSGMLALSMPDLGKHIVGLVLMNTTTKQTFFETLESSKAKYNLPDLSDSFIRYHSNPSKEEYKKYWDNYKHYCFTKDELPYSDDIIKTFAFNNDSYNMAIAQFYNAYEAKWIPNIPTLTIASDLDYICPSSIFVSDNNYDKENIMNVIIPNSGHLPWVLHMNDIQEYFDIFCKKLN